MPRGLSLHNSRRQTRLPDLLKYGVASSLELLRALGAAPTACHLIMDRAYEGNETGQLALDLASSPLCRPSARASSIGNTTVRCIVDATRSNDCPRDLRVSVE